ncbi:unnamed protein product [Miscanthus lutarioriparius]|uniref:Uncharacterized protein n=1 Tax=Miscanthus lutarioriparius TaxID=422564 RepID=A0A811NJF4_9POAL|nr:unnamed protein product [Miscanthus lutarioriparius]
MDLLYNPYENPQECAQGSLDDGCAYADWDDYEEASRVATTFYANTSPGIIKSMLPRVRTIVRFRPQVLNSEDSECEMTDIPWKKISDIPCANRQAHRRRSEGYKVKKIDVTKRRTVPIQDSNSVCGVVLVDGSSCLEHPVHGRKRCSLHKGKRVKGNPKGSPTSYPCQVEIAITEFVPRPTEDLDSSVPKQESEILPKNMSIRTLKEPLRESNSLESENVNTGEAPTEDGAREISKDACALEEKASHAESESQEQQPSGRMWFDLLKSQRKSASAHPSRGSGSQITAMTDNRPCKMVSIAGMESKATELYAPPASSPATSTRHPPTLCAHRRPCCPSAPTPV